MTPQNDIPQINLITKGWTLYEIEPKDEDLVFLASGFGTVYPDDNGKLIQYLMPKEAGQGFRDSFSYNLGFNEFPYHTDTAYWAKPAQIILMASEKPSCCDTILIDSKQLIDNLTAEEISLFSNAVYTLKTSGGIKFVSVLEHTKTSYQIRYDPNIMTPFNTSAKKTSNLINEFITHAKRVVIKWTGTNAVILNNWRVLHKRSECSSEPNRILKRIYIYE